MSRHPHIDTAFSVGLTGGIGSGKSMVADMFAARGAALIDTDVVAHQVTSEHGAAMAAIERRFGEEYLLPNGAMNRKKMRDLVFSDPEAKIALESIVHPLIRDAVDAAAAQAQGDYLMFVVPLLIESGTWKQRVSRVLVVDCPEQTQILRVQRRSALDEAQIRAIMAAQAPRAVRLAAADDVLVNDGDPTALEPQVDRLHALYCALAQSAVINHAQHL
ncbi:MAG: dephospho-CoA kinase [Burkholderiaceae bacterium]|nr:dephospho-CoA kinase [Burkholderiaceae bacterium]